MFKILVYAGCALLTLVPSLALSWATDLSNAVRANAATLIAIKYSADMVVHQLALNLIPIMCARTSLLLVLRSIAIGS